MSGVKVRVPRRLPEGTKFVVEGEDAPGGGVRIIARYLVYPSGRRVDLLAGAPRHVECCARKTQSATRHRRAAQRDEIRLAF